MKQRLLLFIFCFHFGASDSFLLKAETAEVGDQVVVSENDKNSGTKASLVESEPKIKDSAQADSEHIVEAQNADGYPEEVPEVGPKVERPKDWRKKIEREERTEVTWDDLYEFDYRTGTPTPFLKAISGKPVRLPGFVIPLTDGDVEKMKEFLIVPEPMMCIHVPPPPPNLLLYGTANPPISVSSLWEPLWLDGEIKVEKKKSIYAEAGFTMKVTGIKQYEEPGE